MFVLIYPFTSQIFCINNDIMRRFTYNEKNRDDLLQYIVHHLGGLYGSLKGNKQVLSKNLYKNAW